MNGDPVAYTTTITLQPFTSHHHTSTFYIPYRGLYVVPPVSVTKRGKPAWIPSARNPMLNVLEVRPPGMHTPSSGTFEWAKFFRGASNALILEYLAGGDLSLARLDDLAPRCWDRTFFEAATQQLSARHVYVQSIWNWAAYHLCEKQLGELLCNSTLCRHLGVPVATPLLTLSARDVGYRHLEYWPWVNPYIRPITRGELRNTSFGGWRGGGVNLEGGGTIFGGVVASWVGW